MFLCLKGKLNVWANDSARSLALGDFAGVPPVSRLQYIILHSIPSYIANPMWNTIHQYQVASTHTEFVGLIIPGGWEEVCGLLN